MANKSILDAFERMWEHVVDTFDNKSVFYYGSLSNAITDVNNETSENSINYTENPKVKVFTADNGRTTVMLLDDISESTQININKDINIVLNGYTISLTTAAAYLNFIAGTNCTIDGEVDGSEIKKEGVTGSTAYLINTTGNTLKIKGGSYSLSGACSGQNIIFRATNACKMIELLNCKAYVTTTDIGNKTNVKCVQSQAAELFISGVDFSAESQTQATCIHVLNKVQIENSKVAASGYITQGLNIATAQTNVTCRNTSITAICTDTDTSASSHDANGVINFGVCKLEKCTVFTDAIGAHDDYPTSIGIKNGEDDILICIDTNVTGTHSGVQSEGDLYITGGTFNGYGHGGFYLIHTPENRAYINNAVIKFGSYTGQFDTYPSDIAKPFAGFYLGSGYEENSQGISAYIDGCTIEGEGGTWISSDGTSNTINGDIIVVRDASEGCMNTLYISNTTNNTKKVAPDAEMKIRLDEYEAELKIGVGCNFTPDDTTDPTRAEETGELYRMVSEDKALDGKDFNALINYKQPSGNGGSAGGSNNTAGNANTIPSVSESDNGKFLCVVDGVPTWTTILNAEEVSF